MLVPLGPNVPVSILPPAAPMYPELFVSSLVLPVNDAALGNTSDVPKYHVLNFSTDVPRSVVLVTLGPSIAVNTLPPDLGTYVVPAVVWVR